MERAPIRAAILMATFAAAVGCGGSEMGDDANGDAAADARADSFVADSGASDTGAADTGIDSTPEDVGDDVPLDTETPDLGPPDTLCGGVACATGICESGECILGTSCLDVLSHGRSTGDGDYWIDPGGGPLHVTCNMSIDGGGWTKLIDPYTGRLGAGTYRYLYLSGARWYESPTTTIVWTWASGQQLTGTYAYSNGTTSGTIDCSGSSETPGFGVGCSSGPGPTAKVLPYYTSSPLTGTCEVCQDVPDAFGVGACTAPGAVSVFIR